MPATFSLHKAFTDKECGFCGDSIPGGRKPKSAEYWRVHLPKSDPGPRVLCCLCHVLLGLPTCGWETPADGEEIVTAKVPETLG